MAVPCVNCEQLYCSGCMMCCAFCGYAMCRVCIDCQEYSDCNWIVEAQRKADGKLVQKSWL
jgi:hypothetical protein